MLSALTFFLLAGATLFAVVWTSLQLFTTQEDFLGNRLAELRSAGTVGGGKSRPGAQGLPGRFLRLVSLIPGAEDWIHGSDKRLRQAGYRGEKALGNYIMIASGF